MAGDGDGGDWSDIGVGEDGNDGDGDTGRDDDDRLTGKADRACVILFLQSDVAVLLGKIFVQHFIKICNGCIIVSFQEEIAKRNIELPLFSFLVLTTNTYAHQVLLTLTWLTVDPLEYCVKADPAEQVDLRNIRSWGGDNILQILQNIRSWGKR